MKKPIGQLLKEKGFITEEYIQFALLEQKATGEKFGEVLVRKGLVTDVEIAMALAEQSGYPFLDVSEIFPSQEALIKVPSSFAKKFGILPLRITPERSLEVAISDPYNLQLIETISRISGMQVSPVISSTTQIKKFLEKAYYFLENPIEEEFSELIEKLKRNPQADFDAEELFEKLLIWSITKRATDLHITPANLTLEVYFRIDGMLEPVIVFPKAVYRRLANLIKVKSGMDIAETRLPQDGRIKFSFFGEEFDLRISTVKTPFGENIVIRILPIGSYVQHLSYLGFYSDQIKIIERLMFAPYGMFLITGPTGSGKTTTLFSCLRIVNLLEKNVLTVEDPIEYVLPLIRQTQVNEEIGYTFARAVRHFLRQDPDIIIVGEVRDEETAQMAVRASLTGHLFLATLHTNNALSTIIRLKDLGIAPDMLSFSLIGILAQRLVRKICPNCKEEYKPDPRLLNYYNLPEDHIYYKGKGCEHCRFKGYIGRTAIAELISIDSDFSALISKDFSYSDLIKLATTKNIKFLIDDAKRKVLDGITTVEEIRRVLG